MCQVLAMVGAIFTVVPAHRMALLDDELARKTIELRRLEAEADAQYVALRKSIIDTYAQRATYFCTIFERDVDPSRTIGYERFRSMLDHDLSLCVSPSEIDDSLLPLLRRADRRVLLAGVDSMRDVFAQVRLRSRADADALTELDGIDAAVASVTASSAKRQRVLQAQIRAARVACRPGRGSCL